MSDIKRSLTSALADQPLRKFQDHVPSIPYGDQPNCAQRIIHDLIHVGARQIRSDLCQRSCSGRWIADQHAELAQFWSPRLR